jgi:ABC-type dipeptide/oligopeptide/nickel transport system ATPase subunit
LHSCKAKISYNQETWKVKTCYDYCSMTWNNNAQWVSLTRSTREQGFLATRLEWVLCFLRLRRLDFVHVRKTGRKRYTMTELFLDSLQVSNFRVFRHLEVARLGRVNLIVGKNNTGKSSLLEALFIYAREGHPAAIWDMLIARGESKTFKSLREIEMAGEQRALDIRYLLHNRSELKDVQQIQIGSLHCPDKRLSLSIEYHTADEQGQITGQMPMFETIEELFLVVQAGNKPDAAYNLDRYLARYFSHPREDTRGIPCILVSANGLGFTTIGRFWDTITLTDLEKQVIQALKIIEPSIDGLSFIAEKTERRREPVIRISRYADRLPLRSLGEGVNRLLGLVLALANAKGGILLIDEIESGLHYSIQTEMWKMVFQIANDLNIQVFATTHSKDCVEAFQRVASEHPEQGVLVRLGRKKDDIVASVFKEADLAVAVEQDVEVR